MPDLICGERIIADTWQRITDTSLERIDQLPEGQLLLPLEVWNRLACDGLSSRSHELGLWLSSGQLPDGVQGDLKSIPVIAVEFPVFADGRGFSIGYLLRSRFGYSGQLRAIGAPIRDQLTYLRRCGFDAMQLAENYDPVAALASLHDFSEVYQTSFDQPLPLFRRRS